MKLSIVTTLYQSELYINEFYERASSTAMQLVGEHYEIVMVNDGSTDNSLKIVVDLYEKDSHVVVVDLSRNFGHHKAMMAGLKYAKGNKIFLIDSDLEEDPELLLDFWDRMDTSGADSVFGIQDHRKGGWFERWTGSLFYKLFNYLSNTQIPENQLNARLMSRRFVNAFISHKEQNLFFGGIFAMTGFSQIPIICSKRNKGHTSYNLFRKMSQFVNSVTGFSSKLLYFVFYMGAFISIIAFSLIFYLVTRRLIYDNIPDGWTSLMLAITGFSGIIILSLGLVGIYISKIFEEVKARPNVIVRNVFRTKI